MSCSDHVDMPYDYSSVAQGARALWSVIGARLSAMVEIAEYQPGTPCWVELWTADRPASMDFYASVFGWDYQVAPEDQHFFTVAQLKSKAVAGMLTPPGNPDAPMVWVTYLAVTDLEATLAAVPEHGGQAIA